MNEAMGAEKRFEEALNGVPNPQREQGGGARASVFMNLLGFWAMMQSGAIRSVRDF